MKWRALDRVKLTSALVVTDFGPHRPMMGREWIQTLVILSSFPRVNQLEGKQALTLEAVLERHSAVFLEELGHISIKLGLPLKPDARPVDPRAPPEPPALRDTGGRRCGDGTGGSRSRRDASEHRDASGR